MIDLTPLTTDEQFTRDCTEELAGWLFFVKRACDDALRRVRAGYITRPEYRGNLREARNAPLFTAGTTKERLRRSIMALRRRPPPLLP